MANRYCFIGCAIFIISILQFNCSSKYVLVTEVNSESAIPPELLNSVKALSPSYNIYDETRYIRTYFHFINSADSSLNYNAVEAPDFVKVLLYAANERLRTNDRMNLPYGNKTPVQDTKIRYELSNYEGTPGIFYHYEQEPRYFIKKGKQVNRYERKVIAKYGCDTDSVVNVFVMPYDPEQLKSGIQKLEQTAIALGSSIKLPGVKQIGSPAWAFASIFNHEMGHVLGLRHTWKYNDGCEDTPYHTNCWNKSEEPPCNVNFSNNMMDYNAHQSAITPCQIARMHDNIAHPGRIGNKIAVENWCNYNPAFDVLIEDQQQWSSSLKLTGNIIIEKGGVLFLTSSLHMTRDASITIKKGGTLIMENATLYNSCNENWQGILCHPSGNIYFLGDRNVIQNVRTPALH